jgi:hypothetical protein
MGRLERDRSPGGLVPCPATRARTPGPIPVRIARLSLDAVRVPRRGPVHRHDADPSAYRMEQSRGDECGRDGYHRRREAEKNLNRQPEQCRPDSADHYCSGRVGQSPLQHFAPLSALTTLSMIQARNQALRDHYGSVTATIRAVVCRELGGRAAASSPRAAMPPLDRRRRWHEVSADRRERRSSPSWHRPIMASRSAPADMAPRVLAGLNSNPQFRAVTPNCAKPPTGNTRSSV